MHFPLLETFQLLTWGTLYMKLSVNSLLNTGLIKNKVHISEVYEVLSTKIYKDS